MKSSQALDRYLKFYPYALDDPIKHFGPNYETLLNFWCYLDSLDLPAIVRNFDYKSTAVFGYHLEDYCKPILLDQYSVWSSTTPENCINRSPLGYSSLEIVCMHKLFEDGRNLVNLPKLEKVIGGQF